MLSRYENDHILPSIATLSKLAQALSVSAAGLLGDPAEPAYAFVEGLSVRGITMADGAQATRLSGVIADMVDADDARVRFLRTGEKDPD
jgi:transcriptional regulator with XRE-family HTH domain